MLLQSIALLLFYSAATAATESKFVIMSAEEIQQHRTQMNTLHGAEREAYRNAQYQQLRIRARDNGYILPPTPVWQLPVDPRMQERERVREAHRKAAAVYREDMRKRFDDFMARQQQYSQPPPATRPAMPTLAPVYRPYPTPMSHYPYPLPPARYWRPLPPPSHR